MASVEHIFICIAHRVPMREVEQIRAVEDRGLANCAHGRQGSKRQVLLLDRETLDEFDLAPGIVKENITTGGLPVRELAHGQRIQIGEALLEVTLPCEPCGRMDGIRRGLQVELRGKRGMLCRVLESGIVRRGDLIELVPAPQHATSEKR